MPVKPKKSSNDNNDSDVLSLILRDNSGYGASQHPTSSSSSSSSSSPKSIPYNRSQEDDTAGYGASQHPIAYNPYKPVPYIVTSADTKDSSKPGYMYAIEEYMRRAQHAADIAASKLGNGSNSPGGTGGSGGTGTGGSNSSNINSIYDALRQALMESQGRAMDLTDEQIAAVQGYYDNATKDFYDQYVNSRNDLADRSGNLGVELDKSTIGAQWDAALRNAQEMSDSNLTSDLSYFEKMKGTRDLAFQALMAGAENDRANRLLGGLAGGSGGGGGGGGRGGSSGNGSINTDASETSTVNNVGDYELYNELARTNPLAAKMYYDAYWSSGGDPTDAIKLLMGQNNSVTNMVNNVSKINNSASPDVLSQNPGLAAMLNLSNKLNNAVGKYYPSSNAQAQTALQALSGLWGNPKVSQKVVQKS